MSRADAHAIIVTPPVVRRFEGSRQKELDDLATTLMLILCVEDEKAIALCLRKRLENIGATVDIASTWAEACQKLSQKRFDIVTFDILLPDSATEQATERIIYLKNHMDAASIIICSGMDERVIDEIVRETGVRSVPKESVVIGGSLYEEIANAVKNKSGFDENLRLIKKISQRLTPP